MIDFKNIDGYKREVLNVGGKSTLTVNYLSRHPNYFKVQNRGISTLYCSTTNYPSRRNYEFAVGAGKSKLWANPYEKDRLYIYNPGLEDCDVTVISFSADFEPVTLALSDLEIDLSGQTLETTTTISSFESPLPAGSNTIGAVELAGNTAKNLDSLPYIKTATENARNNSEIIKAAVAIIQEKLTALESKTADKWYVAPDVYMVSAELASGATVEETGTTLDLGAATKFHFSFFTNDHATENIVMLVDGWNGVDSAAQKVIKIKPGETLNDFCGICKKISVRGVGMSARYMLYYKVV